MVTQINIHHSQINFTHFVDVPSASCTIGTALNAATKRIKIYLITSDDGPIYQRNGINESWDELKKDQKSTIRRMVKEALADSRVPHYTTDSLAVFN
jgi:U3 small nucleolar ribonucleoprotein component